MAEKVSNAQILKALENVHQGIEAQNANNAVIAEGMQTIIRFMGANQTAAAAQTVSAPTPVKKSVPELLTAHGFEFTEVVGYRVKDWKRAVKLFNITNPEVITDLTEK